MSANRTVGLIGAMEEEVALLKEQMNEVSVTKRAGMVFFRGQLEDRDAVVVRSGICKVNAALCTQILVDTFHVDTVINTGIAGSLDANIDIGDIVISTDAVQHDVHAEVWGYAPGQIPRMEAAAFRADSGLAELAERVCREELPEIGCHRGRVLTGDCFVSDRAAKAQLREIFGGACVEMEGAAIAQAAHVNGIPWLVLRAISDKADNSATVDYSKFEAEAIRNGVKLVRGMLRQM